MDEGQVINVAGIGDMMFVKSSKARHLRVLIKPHGMTRVTVPRGVTFGQAISFVEEKADWIKQMQAKAKFTAPERTVFTPETEFSTATRQVKLFPCPAETFRVRTTSTQLQIFFPQTQDVHSERFQTIIRELIVRRLRQEAKDYLPRRTSELAAVHGLRFNGVAIKQTSSRWGSCSSANHINLNLHLMRLPAHLQDYVILHELAHTVHKNHSPRFWAFLDGLTGGKAKALAAEMKEYRAVNF